MPQVTPPTILILDGDLGFMFAVSLELSQRRIAAFPSRSVKEAQSLMAEFNLNLDVLVVHCGRTGACGFAKRLLKDDAGLRIIGITTGQNQCRRCADQLSATLLDPEDRGPERIAYDADVIQRLVREHRRARPASGNA